MVELNAKLSSALGDRTAKALHGAFGYSTIEDLLRHYPRRYVARGELTDIDQLKDGDEVTVLAEIVDTNNRPMRGRKGSILEVKVSDGKKKLSLTFFNQAWRERDQMNRLQQSHLRLSEFRAVLIRWQLVLDHDRDALQ